MSLIHLMGIVNLLSIIEVKIHGINGITASAAIALHPGPAHKKPMASSVGFSTFDQRKEALLIHR